MDIFKVYQQNSSAPKPTPKQEQKRARATGEGPASDSKGPKRERIKRKRPDRSPQEIRDRLSRHLAKTGKTLAKAGPASETPRAPGQLINDPKSPETQEKLRHLLKSGSFSFSAQEREALKSILS